LYWNGLFSNSVARNARSAGLIVENSSGKLSWPGDSWLPRDSDSCATLISFSPSYSSSKRSSNSVTTSRFSSGS
jgi:hypothetical protein